MKNKFRLVGVIALVLVISIIVTLVLIKQNNSDSKTKEVIVNDAVVEDIVEEHVTTEADETPVEDTVSEDVIVYTAEDFDFKDDSVEVEASDRSQMFYSAQYNSDVNTSTDYVLDVSMFTEEGSKRVVNQLAVDLGCTAVNMFYTCEEFNSDILTKIYYITFDGETVYYVYEQGSNAYILKDDYFKYTEVIEMLSNQ